MARLHETDSELGDSYLEHAEEMFRREKSKVKHELERELKFQLNMFDVYNNGHHACNMHWAQPGIKVVCEVPRRRRNRTRRRRNRNKKNQADCPSENAFDYIYSDISDDDFEFEVEAYERKREYRGSPYLQLCCMLFVAIVGVACVSCVLTHLDTLFVELRLAIAASFMIFLGLSCVWVTYLLGKTVGYFVRSCRL